MRNIMIIIKKQLKDTIKNKTILIQFILFPLMTVIMENAITLEGMPELFFTKLFAIMYIGMAPITSVAAIISEEKEKNTLRVLMMANVMPWQYLCGVGFYVWAICMIGAGVMSLGFSGKDRAFFLGLMGIGFFISILAGACVGIFAKNQMAATSLVMPGMMILAFLPMLSMFNEKIAKVAKIFYTEQLKNILEKMSFSDMPENAVWIILLNAVVFVFLFSFVYKRKGLE
ncbi:MAG: ABC transporter permease [Lachnospiraceae bacterium]|nr:ABC transporter permease [Lachnospiraceae bacterium]